MVKMLCPFCNYKRMLKYNPQYFKCPNCGADIGAAYEWPCSMNDPVIQLRKGIRELIRFDDDGKEDSRMKIGDMFDYLRTKQDELNGIALSDWEQLTKEMKEIFYNLDIKAFDGGIFWKSIDLKNGWSIQINSITNNCRILDDKRYRRCFGPRRLVLGSLIDRIDKKAV